MHNEESAQENDASEEHAHSSTLDNSVEHSEDHACLNVEGYSPQSPTQSVLDGEPEDEHILERAQLQFGFVLPVGDQEFPDVSLKWREVLRILGSTEKHRVSDMQQVALRNFFMKLKDDEELPTDLDDLSRSNHWYLLTRFDELPFIYVDQFYIFVAPRSTTATWYLGVGSPSIRAIYYELLATKPGQHSSFTVASHLIEHGVRFRTFERMPKVNYRDLHDPFQPSMFRPVGYEFTVNDFEASILQARAFLYTEKGRAALLKGGIIGRIAREYLDAERALDGPSREATVFHRGLCVIAEKGEYDFWDDDLTQNEQAIICGTYLMYTGALMKKKNCLFLIFGDHRLW